MWLGQLFLLSSRLLGVLKASISASSELVLELFNPTGGVHKLQLAGVERMANIANVHSKLLAGAASYETVPASAGNLCFDVFWMNAIFHDFAVLELGAHGLEKELNKLGVGEKGLEPPTSTL